MTESERSRRGVAASKWRPTLSEVVDISAALALTLLGLVGFRTAFAGNAWAVTGALAAVLGAGCGFVSVRLRMQAVVAMAAAVVVFVLAAGPIAFRSEAAFGLLPTPAVIGALLDGLGNGWARLLTTQPPAADAGNVRAIPYLCGFAGAGLSVSFALRWPRAPLCVLPPAAVLVTSVLWGIDRPAALLLQGGCFAGVTIGWLSVRHGRSGPVAIGRVGNRRRTLGAGMVVASALTALIVGPQLPIAEGTPRYVLRDHVEPPFDPQDHPSPLSSFRRYIVGGAEEVWLRVEGLPEGSSLRLSVMEAYDGLVWTVAGDGSSGSGSYERLGADLSTGTQGTASVTVNLENERLDSVWLPTVGTTTRASFSGPRADELAGDFRFDDVAQAAVVTGGLESGDRWSLDVVPVTTPDEATLASASKADVTLPTLSEVPSNFVTTANEIVAGASTPHAQAQALTAYFQNGYYSDGTTGARSPAGHSYLRMADFLGETDLTMIGNAEQYASAMALAARLVGLPARVVMGFRPDGDGDVTGAEADVWVEIAFDQLGWVAFDPTPPTNRTPPDEEAPAPEPESDVAQPPPPTTPTTVPVETTMPRDDQPDESESDGEGGGFAIPRPVLYAGAAIGLPLAVLGGTAALIVAVKARRRRRRRTTGAPAQQIAGAWDELVDRVRDAGRAVPPRSTRREAARVIGLRRSELLANAVDGAVFGAAEPTDTDAHAVWNAFDQELDALIATLDRRARLRTAVNVSSLRGQR